jgi:hypothetical protein
MKKIVVIICLMIGIGTVAFSQSSISVVEIWANVDKNGVHDGSYTVKFRDNDNVYLDDHNSTQFTWYLSYKGKRISDYVNSSSSGNRNFFATAFAWPDEVPKGNEKYVTAQLGKEPVNTKKNRRD